MQMVLTLISHQPSTRLDTSLITTITHALNEVSVKLEHFSWLNPEKACDLIVDHESLSEVTSLIQKRLIGLPIDVILQPHANRRKRLLAIDMESTLIENELLDDLAHEIGITPQVCDITTQAMNGTIDFDEAFRKRLHLLAGTPVSVFETIWQNVRFSPGGKTLVQTMQAHGSITLLVSGGLRWFTNRVADHLKFDAHHGNDVEIIDQHLSGRPIMPLIDKMAKKRLVIETAHQHGLTATDVVAVGDGANDLPMLRWAGLGLAYRAKDIVMRQTRHHISYGDLTAVLYAQGYSYEEWVQSSCHLP